VLAPSSWFGLLEIITLATSQQKLFPDKDKILKMCSTDTRISDILGCPPSYLSPLSSTDTCLLLSSGKWLGELVNSMKLPPTFPTHPGVSDAEVSAFLADKQFLYPGWLLLKVRTISIPSTITCVSNTSNLAASTSSMALPEVLGHVNTCNLRNMWRDMARKLGAHGVEEAVQNTGEWLEELMVQVKRTYGEDVLIINTDTNPVNIKANQPDISPIPNLIPLHCVVISSDMVLFLHAHKPHTITTMYKFSPALLADSQTKTLFLLHQILQIFHSFHSRGIALGDSVGLHQFHIDHTLHLLFDYAIPAPYPPASLSLESSSLPSPSSPFSTPLSMATLLWTRRELSTLQYLLLLNHLAGRRFGQPNNHPVVPWVTDFTCEQGGYRDLSKSKFRLNKGDEALDMTYETGQHHVTDVLSEITYYTYKSRVTEKEVLCRYVRPSWVPAEYPASIARMMSWSPDEAIPEFYTDPSIFTSIHPDLPDLSLPSWVESGEEFCSWHLDRLEGDTVSRQVHTWIDLTFGYKLSGSAAVRSKNVCLDIADGHSDLRGHGVVQLFTVPHPARGQVGARDMPLGGEEVGDVEGVDDDSDEEDNWNVSNNNGDLIDTQKIAFPTEFNPVADLIELENLNYFLTKTVSHPTIPAPVISPPSLVPKPMVVDMQVLGCLVVELFLPRKMVSQTIHSSLKERYDAATKLLMSLPPCVKTMTSQLLLPDNMFSITSSDRYPPISDFGLPLPSPHQLLSPIMSPVPFPSCFPTLVHTLSSCRDLQEQLTMLSATHPKQMEEHISSVSEFCVLMVARSLSPILPSLSQDCLELVIPLMTSLLLSPNTAVFSSWLLLDKVASTLGPDKTKESFLTPVTSLYLNGSPTAKHAKLYHRSFLMTLIVRFKLKVFLENFTNYLVEAVGGYKDLEWDTGRQGLDQSIRSDKKEEVGDSVASQVSENLVLDKGPVECETFSEGEVFAFDSLDEQLAARKGGSGTFPSDVLDTVVQNLGGKKYGSQDSLTDVLDVARFTKVVDNEVERKENEGNISTIAGESVLWLAHRLGPVLACRFLTRNLLRMLGLCYLGAEAVKDTNRHHRNQKIRVSQFKVGGDIAAGPVLECLAHLVGLFGDSLVVVQYLPYCWDLVSRAKKRISSSLEGGLLGCLAMLHSSLPLLSDTVLMNELPHSLLAHLLVPLLQVVTTRRVTFTGGARPRLVLLNKLLDTVYMVGLRIGEEMARTHLTPLVTGLFSSFDKLESHDQDPDPALAQLRQVLTPSTAFSAYICFYQLLGVSHMEANISNLSLVRRLCCSHQASLQEPTHRPLSFVELQGLPHKGTSTSFGGSGTGNMIVVSEEDGAKGELELISRPATDSARQLKGNWLAYWEHEIGRDERDVLFNLKQIKLQSFAGHTGSVRSLAVLDNENSFLSGGKDRTVRLWSVRNTGEGEAIVGAQSVYSGHRKSVFSVSFLPGPGLAVSCDGSVQLWDPFVLGTVREYDTGKDSRVTFCAVRPLHPGQGVVAATSEGGVRVLDTRMAGAGTELKVSYGAAGLIRSLAVGRDGSQLAVGHSSGYISMLDLRTGRLRTGFKAHDGEVLTLTNISTNYFVSTSLDQTASGWKWEDGRLAANLRAPPEPLHCVCPHEGEVIMGSTANRLTIQQGVDTDSTASVHKLRSDLLRGNLSQVACMPLNKLLLLATDSGYIHLVC